MILNYFFKKSKNKLNTEKIYSILLKVIKMEFLWIPIVIAAIISLILLVAFICYRLTFYAKKQPETQEYPIPPGEIYEPYRETMVGWMKEARSIVKEELSITSFDGLKLFGRY